MMQPGKKPGVDVILDVLLAAQEALPASVFISSLLQQYRERGGLSRKQLEGLHAKASKLSQVHPAKLATLQAIILRKPQRHRSAIPVSAPIVAKDPVPATLIRQILERYPAHKRVLFLKARYEQMLSLPEVEKKELERLAGILLKAEK
jgi:hypothetical protein